MEKGRGGEEKIAEIAVIADIARDRKKQKLTAERGDAEKNRIGIEAGVSVRQNPTAQPRAAAVHGSS